MHRIFQKIAERFSAMVYLINGEKQILDDLEKVFPRVMPSNHVLMYQWMPPRKDPRTGDPMETNRLRIYLCPVAKKGDSTVPRPDEISRILDEFDVPKEVKMPEALEIPPEIKALKRPEEIEVIAARMGVTIPAAADLRAAHVLLAREANTSVKGKDVLKQMREAAGTKEEVPA